jgi:hypothetical protein
MRPGPKTEVGDLRRVTLLLDPLAEDMLTALGKGNLSRGARNAARVAYAAFQLEPDVSPCTPNGEPGAPSAPARRLPPRP